VSVCLSVACRRRRLKSEASQALQLRSPVNSHHGRRKVSERKWYGSSRERAEGVENDDVD